MTYLYRNKLAGDILRRQVCQTQNDEVGSVSDEVDRMSFKFP